MKTNNVEEPHTPGGEWCVSRCACGAYTLRVGFCRMEFSAEDFARLYSLMTEAVRQFGVEQDSPPSDAVAVKH